MPDLAAFELITAMFSFTSFSQNDVPVKQNVLMTPFLAVKIEKNVTTKKNATDLPIFQRNWLSGFLNQWN